MVRKKIEITSAIIAISAAIVSSGCAGQPAPDVAKTGNVNQSLTVSNNSNAAVNPPNTPPPVVNNTPPPIVAKNNKSPRPVEVPTPQIGSGGSDIFLFTQVRGALSSDEELANAVIIEIKEGNATLTGSISSEAQKMKAARLVQSVKGVKSIKNNLRVSS